MILGKEWQFGSKSQKQTAGTGELEKAVGNGAAWAGGAGPGRALNAVLINLDFMPEAPGSHHKWPNTMKPPEWFHSSS